MSKPNINLSEWVDVLDETEVVSMSLGELIESSAAKYPNSEALVYSNQPDVKDVRWTYADLNNMSSYLAKAFIDIGLNPGDTVGVWGPNHPEWILTEYALAKAGLRLVTLNPLYKEKELVFALSTVSAAGLIHADIIGGCESIDIINKIKNDISSLKHVYSFHKGLVDLIEKGKNSTTELPKVNPDDIFMIQYTSGTTGIPKAAQMTHQSLITSSKNSHLRWEIRANQRVCHGFPLFHIGGSACMTLGAAATGAVSLPIYIFKPDVTLDILQNEKCSIFIGAPVLLTAMLEVPNFNEYDLSELKCLVVGGSNPPLELLKKFSDEFDADVINGYGNTSRLNPECI